MNAFSSSPPPALEHELARLVDGALSLPARLGYVALLLAASAMTVIVGSLLLTEQGLPFRTQLAFSTMALIGSAWIGFAIWVLTHTRPLLGRHRLVAGRLAVLFCTLFLAGTVAVRITMPTAAASAAAGLGVVMLGVAIAVLMRARRIVARLQERRVTLERELKTRPR